ncbi:MAG: CotH kinase family protein [Firmicutes bacterium]|nr:CotH kinase family protein [Bacillota bacterium]
MKKAAAAVVIFMTVAASLFLIEISRELAASAKEGGRGDRTAPVLSVESGFYDEPFMLAISAPEGAQIYYTLDGGTPGPASLPYTEPLEITYRGGASDVTVVPNAVLDWSGKEEEVHSGGATVVRAVAVYEDGQVSDTVTATYFIGEAFYRDKLIVSLVADPEDLFGENGIYVTGKAYDDWYLGEQSGEAPTANFMQRGEEWERPAVLELFQGNSILQQPVGIRIQGASMRNTQNKRFSVYARKKYGGSSWFDAPVFGEDRCHSFVLRSGFMNGYIQHLVQDRDIASAESKECIVYLNGAVWYITIAQEKYSRKYFQEKYGVDDDNVVIVKAGALAAGEAEDIELYQAVYDFLNTHDMSTEASYEQLDRLMDIQSYIDFSCVNVYFANLDYNETKNCLCWRARRIGPGEYEDGRWRWGLYDLDLENLDYGFYMEEINTFTLDTHYAGGAFNTRPMYVALRQNPLFCRQFVLSFMDMVNTDLTAERGAAAMESWEITPEWWGMQQDWAEKFFPARTEFITECLAEEFGLTGSRETLLLSVNDAAGGKLLLNTIEPDLSEGEWSGSYFTDYPVTVTAVANSGYRFKEWRIGGDGGTAAQEETLTVEIPEGGLTLQAVFEKR